MLNFKLNFFVPAPLKSLWFLVPCSTASGQLRSARLPSSSVWVTDSSSVPVSSPPLSVCVCVCVCVNFQANVLNLSPLQVHPRLIGLPPWFCAASRRPPHPSPCCQYLAGNISDIKWHSGKFSPPPHVTHPPLRHASPLLGRFELVNPSNYICSNISSLTLPAAVCALCEVEGGRNDKYVSDKTPICLQEWYKLQPQQ